MATKGDEAVIVISSEDEDSDFEFFTAPKRKIYKAPSPQRSPSPVHSSGSEDENGDRKKKKRKKVPNKSRRSGSSDLSKSKPSKRSDRASKENSRGRSTSHIEISPSIKGKGKAKADSGRKRSVELTPPPEMSAEHLEGIRRLVQQYLPGDLPVDIEQDTSYETSSPPSGTDEVVIIKVHMKSDPKRLKAGVSEKAIQVWEKERLFRFGRKLSMLLRDLATKLGREPEDLVLVHNGRRIAAMTLTPMHFGISGEAIFDGWEKSVWDRMEEEKRERLQRQLDGEIDETQSSPVKEDLPAPLPPVTESIKLQVRGTWGTMKVAMHPTHTVKKLIHHYCTKMNILDQESKIYLEFDGETREPGDTMKDVEVEDGDMLDLVLK